MFRSDPVPVLERLAEPRADSQDLVGPGGGRLAHFPRDTLSASFQYRESDSYITRSIFFVAYGAGATGGPTITQGAATAVGNVSQGNGASQDQTS